jgi:TRAP-type transport system small permease protein
MLLKAANSLKQGLTPLTNIMGIIGASIIGLMMLVTVIDVGGRRLFNSPLLGSMDLTTLMMVIVVFFSIAHTELKKGHITIDLIVPKLPVRVQNFIMSIMYFLSLIIFGWMTWRIGLSSLDLMRNNTVSATLQIPVFPFMFLATLGCALLSLLVLAHFLQYAAGGSKR